MKFKVTVNFDRKRFDGKIETSEREGIVEAGDRDKAKKLYLQRVKGNEPNRRRINWVKVRDAETGKLV